jgi:hypothetical protein
VLEAHGLKTPYQTLLAVDRASERRGLLPVDVCVSSSADVTSGSERRVHGCASHYFSSLPKLRRVSRLMPEGHGSRSNCFCSLSSRQRLTAQIQHRVNLLLHSQARSRWVVRRNSILQDGLTIFQSPTAERMVEGEVSDS